MIYILCIITLIAGAGLGLLYGTLRERKRTESLQTDLARLQAAIEMQEQNTASTLDAQKAASESAIAAQKDHYEKTIAEQKIHCEETFAAQKNHYEELLRSQQKHFEETLSRVTAEIKLSTDEMLKERQKEFAETSTHDISQIVTPLKESLHKMMHQSELTMRSADELVRVLHHGSKVQGDWGETILDELLESQGLTRGVHYDIQSSIRESTGQTVRTDSGATLRPDVILHLDHQREVIIDSKVSLTSFIDFVNAETEAERQQYLRAHVESLENHVKQLARKDYSSYIQPPKVRMDYVIMFVPNTGALWTALRERPDLWRRAMERNVFIADEQTLFAALRIVALTWKQIEQAENQQRVFSLATEMMDRVGQFMKKYQTIGKALDTAFKAYEEGERKLQPTGQSILQTCAKLQKLGAKQSSVNPLPQLDNPES
ncbi:MAG: DNA recombination protein RmuC [Bacteroidaceae bacterium]|nr:DNA recombination protein RmuC [Bacteroidaceae bacterium]